MRLIGSMNRGIRTPALLLAVAATSFSYTAISATGAAAASSDRTDRQLAKRAALSLSDFANGWRTYVPDDSSDIEALAKRIPVCASYNEASSLSDAAAHSAEGHFTDGDEAKVDDSVSVFPSARQAESRSEVVR